MHTPFRNLNPSLNTCGFHPGGNIDGIAPNVVIQLCRTNDSGSDITKVESDPENKNELKNEKKIKKKHIKNFYRPGQLNWEFWLWMEIPQCGNLAIFLGLWFHVKTILADFRRSIIAVLTILEALNFDSWKNFTLDNVKITKNSNLRTAQIVKMAVFGAPKWPKLILHEI